MPKKFPTAIAKSFGYLVPTLVSIGIHGLFLIFASKAAIEGRAEEPEIPEPVRVIELTPQEMKRLPTFSFTDPRFQNRSSNFRIPQPQPGNSQRGRDRRSNRSQESTTSETNSDIYVPRGDRSSRDNSGITRGITIISREDLPNGLEEEDDRPPTGNRPGPRIILGPEPPKPEQLSNLEKVEILDFTGNIPDPSAGSTQKDYSQSSVWIKWFETLDDESLQAKALALNDDLAQILQGVRDEDTDVLTLAPIYPLEACEILDKNLSEQIIFTVVTDESGQVKQLAVWKKSSYDVLNEHAKQRVINGIYKETGEKEVYLIAVPYTYDKETCGTVAASDPSFVSGLVDGDTPDFLDEKYPGVLDNFSDDKVKKITVYAPENINPDDYQDLVVWIIVDAEGKITWGQKKVSSNNEILDAKGIERIREDISSFPSAGEFFLYEYSVDFQPKPAPGPQEPPALEELEDASLLTQEDLPGIDIQLRQKANLLASVPEDIDPGEINSEEYKPPTFWIVSDEEGRFLQIFKEELSPSNVLNQEAYAIVLAKEGDEIFFNGNPPVLYEVSVNFQLEPMQSSDALTEPPTLDELKDSDELTEADFPEIDPQAPQETKIAGNFSEDIDIDPKEYESPIFWIVSDGEGKFLRVFKRELSPNEALNQAAYELVLAKEGSEIFVSDSSTALYEVSVDFQLEPTPPTERSPDSVNETEDPPTETTEDSPTETTEDSSTETEETDRTETDETEANESDAASETPEADDAENAENAENATEDETPDKQPDETPDETPEVPEALEPDGDRDEEP